MRVLVCPDSFTGTLTATQAAQAIKAGWLSQYPEGDVELVPLSDGGPGFAQTMATALNGELNVSTVVNLVGVPEAAQWCMVGDTAYIESASAVGMHLVRDGDVDIFHRHSFGIGQLVAHAIDAGARHIVIGLGGTGINDAGLGALMALGAQAFAVDGEIMSNVVPADFAQIARIDLQPALQRIDGVTLEVATDVDNPLLGLRGATHTYAPQKGASSMDVINLESALVHLVSVIGRRSDGKDPAVALGAGAAGGLAYGLLCLGAKRSSGISRIIEAVGLAEHMASSDVVLSGEGHFDWQSLRGKVVTGVAAAAMEYARPVVVLAGQVSIGRRDWSAIGVSAAYACVEDGDEMPASPWNALYEISARAARTWGRR